MADQSKLIDAWHGYQHLSTISIVECKTDHGDQCFVQGCRLRAADGRTCGCGKSGSDVGAVRHQAGQRDVSAIGDSFGVGQHHGGHVEITRCDGGIRSRDQTVHGGET